MILIGILTGAAGGILRDVLSAEIPLMFRLGRLYATAALAGAVAYELLDRLGVHREAAAATGMALIAVLRIGAIYRSWRLPTLRLRSGTHHPGT